MKTIKYLLLIFFINVLIANQDFAQEVPHTKNQNAVSAEWINQEIIDNPMNTAWLKSHLNSGHPRIILTEKIERQLIKGIKKDEVLKVCYNYLKEEADRICSLPVLERKKVGRRLLGVSRDAVSRIGVLSLVYRIENNDKYLDRLTKELNAVSAFSDWNPSHFLDVAEMSFAVAIGLDWCGEWLPESTVENAKAALKKHLEISLDGEDYNWWINAEHNWNQVCHGGLSAAALVMAEDEPELAAKIIKRAIDKLPLAMASYSPDGAYPEGPSYWNYGTSYNLLAISMFESAFGTDFNLYQSPGFMESALYRMIVVGPSGEGFNYSDAGTSRLDLGTLSILSWFAQKTGDALYFNKEKILEYTKKAIDNGEEPSRLAPEMLIWMSQFHQKNSSQLPVYWKAEGLNPIAVFGSENDENTGFFLAVKGGKASNNHGNMDVGSFIFELNGVRWSIDPGNQSYYQLETTIGSENLWDQSQNSQRWSLLTKGNQFHSTLTINGARHNVDGFAPITEFEVKDQSSKKVSLDLKEVFEDRLNDAKRTFIKEDGNTLRIEDDISSLESTETITWNMITQSDVTTTENGAVLQQNSKKLKLTILEPAKMKVSVISLDPPPLPYDKQIDNLKKISIIIPSYIFEQGNGKIVVKLEGID